jgi:prepilin-type N-terminal cleavage/methylation domain-containing protein
MNALPRQKGFSVVELLITLAVACMGVIIIGTIYATAGRLADRSTDLLAANAVAYGKLQSYENKGFANIPYTTDGTAVEDFSSSIPSSIPGARTGFVYVSRQSSTLKYIFIRVTYGSTSAPKVIEYGDFIQSGGLGR